VEESRRPRGGEALTAKEQDIGVVRFKYLGNVINDTNDETEKIRARVPAANKAYCSLQTVFRSK
jgi:hypothetical protein